ncbi:MAG: Rieske (2Fe-2S) protein [Proteobacteria bacterium]|nr:Rieske (2Fe-2S) protein [Pseudomonadota bacterium]
MTGTWARAISVDALKRKRRAVVRLGGKQIALFDTADGVYACNNRCPHEGYPLREGALDDGCLLTCNWHNWKFDLKTGANLYGGDRLRVYPAETRDGEVWVDVADPPFEERRAAIMVNLRDAFDDHAYARIAREIARLGLAGGDPVEAVAEAILWSYDRLEFGWTHAYAGAAEWLALYDERDGDPETQLVCLIEIVGHIADNVLHADTYPYAAGSRRYDEDAFVEAVDGRDEAAAVAMVRGALGAGLGFAGLERGLARAALAHYNDFGHSLIYVVKAGRLIGRLGPRVEAPVLLALVRSIVFARREDQIPEFRGYAPALEAWGRGSEKGKAPAAEAFRGLNAKQALALAARHGAATPESLYRALLGANAANMLAYDLAYQEHIDRPIRDNVGWLSFTHGITFANAVRVACARFPELWPQGLLQLACFSGRNAPYTDPTLDGERWRIDDTGAFFAAAVEALFDHGRDEYIVSVHFVKTLLAAREEVRSGAAGEHAGAIAAALNRFLHSPLKRKHALRTARQAIDFVKLDG